MTDRPVAAALEMCARMQTLAAEGDWEGVETTVVRLRAAIGGIPEAERRSVALAAERAIRRVAREAEARHRMLTDRLSALRRGRAAVAAYQFR